MVNLPGDWKLGYRKCKGKTRCRGHGSRKSAAARSVGQSRRAALAFHLDEGNSALQLQNPVLTVLTRRKEILSPAE